ncbi:hypothetical protein BSL82_10535 [Tardibacter chloracetimidivorans]|uniref:Luciferase-like domain-containing protein n=1 Tax=Tardibacter chloracetimidivorans TaxID=1921510 RepID=A0A1L3ZVP5_9SPHN|nr:LLM class F420-dependent oxidoreductase [Tardibacter chloracetimidivorans]API59702.1 hypothetical protein BSL82_10535 [Tardibacter chloracetimidivorans]
MKFGVLTMNTDECVDPVRLAKEAEAQGIESLFVPDHSHVPVTRRLPYGGPTDAFDASPGDMPRDYYRNRDQLLTLAAIAAVTTTLKIGTGVCLVVQRDPILLAKEIATLDHLSQGRLIFGIGAGAPWNEEEMRNHGTDPRTRFTLLGERMAAMKAIWANDQAEYHGRFVDFEPLHSWPKPAQKPHPPILVGGWAPSSLDRVLSYGDGWMPGDGGNLAQLSEMIRQLQDRAVKAGRGPVEITIFMGSLDRVDEYAAMGVSRCVFMLPSIPHDDTFRTLEEISAAARRFGA